MEAALTLLGIDGGGTRGRLLAVASDGRVLGASHSGPLNPNNSAPETVCANLRAGMAGLPAVREASRVHAGVAGIKTVADGERYAALASEALGIPGDRIRVVNDIEPLLLGGLAGAPGIALILGTGSHAIGRDAAGRTQTCGGWGFLMDDCGSGYAIGHRALRNAVRMWDERLKATPLADHVADFLGLSEPGEALHRVYDEGLDFAAINDLGRRVVGWAADGEPGARAIVDDAVEAGLELVTTLARRLDLDAPQVVVTGGVAAAPFIRRLLETRLNQRLPGAAIRDPDLPPVAGAVIGAALDVGIEPDDRFLTNLRHGLHDLGDLL